jgi:hypothetical protein
MVPGPGEGSPCVPSQAVDSCTHLQLNRRPEKERNVQSEIQKEAIIISLTLACLGSILTIFSVPSLQGGPLGPGWLRASVSCLAWPSADMSLRVQLWC